MIKERKRKEKEKILGPENIGVKETERGTFHIRFHLIRISLHPLNQRALVIRNKIFPSYQQILLLITCNSHNPLLLLASSNRLNILQPSLLRFSSDGEELPSMEFVSVIFLIATQGNDNLYL